MTVLHNQFDIGQTVYLCTDDEQKPRIITGIRIKPGHIILYDLAQGTHDTVHYELELRADRDVLLTTTN